ncbi:MAG: FHA domain-containing protein [Roseiflexaceae bacterium]|nr:FHA domain-containing protein [Roseiflexaceae bacterium]
MTDRPTLERQIQEARRVIGQLDRELRQLRDWLTTNERAVSSQAAPLRQITEDGIARARTDVAVRDQELQQQRDVLVGHERQLGLITEIERKEREIDNFERERARITALIDRYQIELSQLRSSYAAFGRTAVTIPPCELVLPSNVRLPLDPAHGDLTIGWADVGAQRKPEIDTTAFGGGSMGVSRSHAVLRLRESQWEIEDLSSTNGTFLNDTQIAPRMPTMLMDKTTIRVGNLQLFFRYILQTTRL